MEAYIDLKLSFLDVSGQEEPSKKIWICNENSKKFWIKSSISVKSSIFSNDETSFGNY